MWQEFLARTVFSVAGHPYLWADVVLDAMRRGDWTDFEGILSEGLACERRADMEDAWPPEREMDQAANDFRYARDLLAAADLTAWLAAAGLTLDHWLGFLQRRILRTSWREQVGALMADHPPSMSDLLDSAPVDGLCSGAFMRFAEQLAGRVALVKPAESVAPAETPVSDPPPVDALEGPTGVWFSSWPEEDLRARRQHLQDVASRFDSRAREAITSSAVEACIHEHQMEWMRVEIESLPCPDETTAREALLCCRIDGLSLSAVALACGGLERGSFLLEELEDDRRDAILSARRGDLLGPFSTGERWDLVTVVSKRPATLDNPDVRRRAEAAVVDALVSAAGATVRWHIRR